LSLILALSLLAPAQAQQGEGTSGGAYAIAGIAVDVSAATPQAARNAAFRIAQRKAWPLLWSRLTGGPVAAAPRLTDGQLDSIVAGIESQGEKFSQTRYIATLGVVFDRSRSAEFFGGASGALQSPPMLLLPMLSDGGARTLFQAKTPWRAAWQRFRENVTPIDYILAAGSAGDNVLLTNWQVKRPDRPSWRNILNRFDTVDVLTAEARLVRSFPGGPITATFIARHGPDATELGRATLTAADDEGLDALLDAGVRKVDEIYSAALQSGRLQSEPDLTADLAPIVANAPFIGGIETSAAAVAGAVVGNIDALMVTPDAATATSLEALLRGTPGVTAVTITSLSLGGTSRVLISHASPRDALAFELDQRGLRLVTEDGATIVRRRREGDPPVPRPVAPEPVPTTPPATPPPAPIDAGRRPASEPRQAPPSPGDGPVNLVPQGGA
jgi:hypothetical protein